MGLTAQQIRDLPAPAPHVVEVQAFGGVVHVKKLTAGEHDELDISLAKDRSNFRAKWAAACLCDQDGNKLFSMADVPMLASKAYKDLDAIFDAAVTANGVTVEDLQKN